MGLVDLETCIDFQLTNEFLMNKRLICRPDIKEDIIKEDEELKKQGRTAQHIKNIDTLKTVAKNRPLLYHAEGCECEECSAAFKFIRVSYKNVDKSLLESFMGPLVAYIEDSDEEDSDEDLETLSEHNERPEEEKYRAEEREREERSTLMKFSEHLMNVCNQHNQGTGQVNRPRTSRPFRGILESAMERMKEEDGETEIKPQPDSRTKSTKLKPF